MLQIALSQFRMHSRRFIAVGLAVLMSVAFLSTALMVSASTQASLGSSLGEVYKKADFVATPAGGMFSEEALRAASATPGTAVAYGLQSAYVRFAAGGEQVSGTMRNLAPEALEASALVSGRFPAVPGEVALDAGTAGRYGVAAGEVLAFDAGPGSTAVELTVSGLLAGSNDPFASALPQLLAQAPAVTALANPQDGPAGAAAVQYESIQVLATQGSAGLDTQQRLTAALADAGAADALVRTATEQVTSQVAMMTGGKDELTLVLLVFAGVALVVAGLVVSNTFGVLVAQRTRELALLRCLGAGRNQVRNSVLLEALVVGVVSSVLGVLAGTGLMAGLIGWARSQPDMSFATLAVPPSAIIAGLTVGTLLTLMAAIVPARAATSVAPLAALRPADDASIRNSRGRIRLVAGVIALAVGIPLLVVGANLIQIVVAFAGGLLSFLGVLLCGTLFIPRLVALFGRLAVPAGVPGRLAALNAVRNPGRTSVTAAALLIGVTLVALMMTGASTARVAFDDALAENYPVDMMVMSSGAGLTTSDRDAVRSVAGIAAAELVPPAGQVDLAGISRPVFALTAAEAANVLIDSALVLEPGKIYLPEGSPAGPITVSTASGVEQFAAVVLKTRNLPPLINSEASVPAAAAAVPATAGEAAVWIRLKDGADGAPLPSEAVRDIQRAVAAAAGVTEETVDGAVIERALFNEVIDVLLLVVTGLLGVAVLIALIGVANTLSLSVLERTRENSLLRALGLTRGQLRGMLALEAVLVAGVAALLGTGLGVVYGWLGAKSALGSLAEVTPAVPWLQLLGVLAVAVIAGLLASVVPARRAARLSPVEGLATT